MNSFDKKLIIVDWFVFFFRTLNSRDGQLLRAYQSLQPYLMDEQYTSLFLSYDPEYVRKLYSSLAIEPVPPKIQKSVEATLRQLEIPMTYQICMSILATLKQVGVNQEDTLCIYSDKGRSWRKELSTEYKQGRKEKRDASISIDIKEAFKQSDWLLDKLKSAGFNVLADWNLEADDIIAMTPKRIMDQTIVCISIDSDLEQLMIYPNFWLFSPHSAHKRYKLRPDNVFKQMAKKIKKEAADGLVSQVLTDDDYTKRESLVSLFSLPDWVEQKCNALIDTIEYKVINADDLPFKSIRAKWNAVYSKSGIVTYEDSVKLVEKQIKKKAKKKK